MALYAAFDLHSTNSVLAVIDEDDRLLRRRRLSNELPAVLRELEPFRDELAGIVVESTYNWYWLVDGLLEHGYRLHLANTAAVPQYAGLKHGDDDSDARHLANLLRLKILPEGFIYPREQRRWRDLLRVRLRLVQNSVGLMHSAQALMARLTGHGLSAAEFRGLDFEQLKGTLPHALDRHALLAPMHVWAELRAQIEVIEATVVAELKANPEYQLVQTTPGIGKVLGPTIALESGPIRRFDRVGQYASYCRMVDSARWSNGKKKGEGNRRCGNAYLAWAYIEAAHFAIIYSEPVRRWYTRKRRKHPVVLARKAVAHKIARGAFYVLRDRVPFDVARAFG
jgi:transposase